MKKLLLGLILLSSVNFVGASEPATPTIELCRYSSCTINTDCPGFACDTGSGCCTGPAS